VPYFKVAVKSIQTIILEAPDRETARTGAIEQLRSQNEAQNGCAPEGSWISPYQVDLEIVEGETVTVTETTAEESVHAAHFALASKNIADRDGLVLLG